MAKKKRKKRGARAPAAADPNERRRERLEKRRQAKEEALRRERRQRVRRRLTRNLLVMIVVVVAIWLLFLRASAPGSIRGHSIESFGRAGAGEHVQGSVDYETLPPVSGPHAGSLRFACGVHSQQIPNEQQVHLLEHGAVGVLYQPDLDPEAISRIEAIVRDHDSHVFSVPYDGMEPRIAVTSWGRKMELSSFDGPAIREYIEEFAGEGPEDQDCPNSANDPFQPEETPAPEEEGRQEES